MRQDIKWRWIEKLRSGEYPQTKNHLQDEKGFCCLGVLCEIAVEDGVIQSWTKDSGTTVYGNKYDSDTSTTTLPDSVMEWAGLVDHNPTVFAPEDTPKDLSGRTTLADLNDSGSNFDTISKYIEEQF
jgi:hypothetical protein